MDVATLRFAFGAWSRPFPELDSGETLVLAFAAADFADRPEPLRELARAYPKSAVIGCSTAGEIDHTRIRDDSITVAVVRFAHGRVRSVTARLDHDDAGREIARALTDYDLRGAIVLAPGTPCNGSGLARGLADALPPNVTITGGLAADGDGFARSWVLVDGRPEPDAAVAVGLYGDRVAIGHGAKHGWDAFGPELAVTRAEGNVVYEIDGKPALAVYDEYLGERAARAPAAALLVPLAVRVPETGVIVRAALGVDPVRQTMTFAGDIPSGATVQLMRANVDRLILSAQAAGGAARPAGTGPMLALAISCIGRRLALGERSAEETEATLDTLPSGTQQIGFYSYGGLSPSASGRCDVHNQTMAVTVLGETT